MVFEQWKYHLGKCDHLHPPPLHPNPPPSAVKVILSRKKLEPFPKYLVGGMYLQLVKQLGKFKLGASFVYIFV